MTDAVIQQLPPSVVRTIVADVDDERVTIGACLRRTSAQPPEATVKDGHLCPLQCDTHVFTRCVVPTAALREHHAELLASKPTGGAAPAVLPLAYDCMRVRDRTVLFFGDHLDRMLLGVTAILPGDDGKDCIYMSTSSNATHLAHQETVERTPPPQWVALLKEALIGHFTAVSDPKHEQNLKFVAWCDPVEAIAGGNGPGVLFHYVIYYLKTSYPPPSLYETGATVGFLYNAMRANPAFKVVQAPLRQRAKELQDSTGVYECFHVHAEDRNYLVPEGSRSNYILVTRHQPPPCQLSGEGNVADLAAGLEAGAQLPPGAEGTLQLLCSLDSDILVGITLKAVRRAALHAGLPAVRHVRLTVGDICACDAIVMTGTSPGVLPINEILAYSNDEGRELFEKALRNYARRCPPGFDADGFVDATLKSVAENGGIIRKASATNETALSLAKAYNSIAYE